MSFSRKRWAETLVDAVEPDPRRGRSIPRYPARSPALREFPRQDGGLVDLRRYLIDDEHEDFVVLVEAEGSRLGWAAAVRREEADMALFLKDPRRLPVTLLWHSNGGRFYAP